VGFFNDPAEMERKENLKALEDKRMAFAEKLAREGFAPEKMFFVQTGNGSFVSLSVFKGKRCLVIAPGFGTDEDFVLERYDALNVRRKTSLSPRKALQALSVSAKRARPAPSISSPVRTAAN